MKLRLVIYLLPLLGACAQAPIDPEPENEPEVEAEAREEGPADAVIIDDEEEEVSSAPKAPEPKPLSKDKAELKNRIVEIELESLGDPKKKTLGLYGDLKACRVKLASPAYGGSGTLFWDEPGDRLSEKWLSSPQGEVQEYQAVLMIVRYRRDYLKNELEKCQQALQARKHDPSLSSSVSITEGDSDNDERVHQYMCRFVRKGASLRDFLIQTFSRGILQLEDFNLDQKFLVASLGDKKGVVRPHGLMFMGWKLSFDRGPLILKDIIFNEKDAKLQYWSFSGKDKIEEGQKSCLKKEAGHWNS